MEVRTRFAPSPTGSMHVGNARTAIFNWLYAKRHGGKFILRIEDTDLERSSKENEEKLLEDLQWLGITWDEGPFNQSQRLELYRQYAFKLVEEKKAFYCFCTDEKLEQDRAKALENKEHPHYVGTCKNLSLSQIQSNLEQKIPYTIRFKVDFKEITFEDKIKGLVRFLPDMFGDFVIIRSNNMPVYNFAVVVDDALMKITHIIRAEEHLSNTARQILLYKALGFNLPVFAHTALILAQDGSKLSKRHGATSVEEYKKKGYLPQGIFNYLTLLGWSSPNGEEKLNPQELSLVFDLDRIALSSAKFDEAKLNWLNGEYLKETPLEKVKPLAINYLKENYPLEQYSKNQIDEIISLSIRGVGYLEQVINEAEIFFKDDFTLPQEWQKPEIAHLGKRLLEEINKEETLDASFFSTLIKNLGKELGLKGKNLFMGSRLLTTGKEQGPDLFLTLALLGKDRLQKRLSSCLMF